MSSVPAGAQTYPNALSVDSAAPELDSAFFRESRQKMASIRLTEHRPTVGLVLSGGGAKGAAQVGALKYIEELGIPVDLVCGTSIGGLLGGLYAIGYRSDDLRELFLGQDWDYILSDAVDQKYIPYSTKQYNTQYVITIPFHAAAEVLEEGVGRTEGEEYEKKSIASSLPSGLASGLNVGNLIASLTVGFHDRMSFNDFQIPYMCVAADLISCKARNWGGGSLQDAMRSTMSVPGLFEPVRTEGMVLVDGGTRNNFPTDIARAMGADYIIGIDLSDAQPGYDQVNNIGDIASQFFTMLGTDSFNRNIRIPDILIKPRIPEFNMMSFNRQAVDTMLVRGYDAAVAKKDELLRLKERTAADGTEEGRGGTRRAVDISKTKVTIGAIEYEGISDKEAERLAKMLDFGTGDRVGKAELDDIMSKYQATGAFASLSYSLLGTEEPYRLVFHCKTSPNHSIGLGFRIDSEEWASILLNLGINTNTLWGSRFNFTAKLGQNLKANAHYSLDIAWLPTINVEASISRYSGSLRIGGTDIFSEVSYWSHQELVYLSDVRWKRINFKTGIKNQYNNVDSRTLFGQLVSQEFSKDVLVGDYIGLFANGHYYTLDDYYYPERGVSFAFDANYDFLKAGSSDFSPMLTLRFDLKNVFPLGGRLALISDIHLRDIYTASETIDLEGGVHRDISILHSNFIGGSMSRRYTEGHIPFFGINNVLFVEDHVFSGSLELRYNPIGKLYVSALAGLMESNYTLDRLITEFNPDYYAFGMELGYDFITGPVRLNLHWNQVDKWGLYVSFGYDF